MEMECASRQIFGILGEADSNLRLTNTLKKTEGIRNKYHFAQVQMMRKNKLLLPVRVHTVSAGIREHSQNEIGSRRPMPAQKNCRIRHKNCLKIWLERAEGIEPSSSVWKTKVQN